MIEVSLGLTEPLFAGKGRSCLQSHHLIKIVRFLPNLSSNNKSYVQSEVNNPGPYFALDDQTTT